jgi:uncharacterized protein (DUF952 family)
MALIFHIADRSQWEAAQPTGAYRHPSLETEGFIHCSTAQQVVWVANSLFRGQHGLVVLCIASDRLKTELRFDEVAGVGQFPHVYGPINCDAVVKVLEFEPNANGEFELPELADESGSAQE